jgi:hypothetical protein
MGLSLREFVHTNRLVCCQPGRKARGVRFRGETASLGPIAALLFEDTCGNLINLAQPTAPPSAKS